jgi:hypothetical protein
MTSILSVSHTLMPPRIGSSARAMSSDPFPRIGKSVSIREARGSRTRSSSFLPSGLKKALILTSAGMSWAQAGVASAQIVAQANAPSVAAASHRSAIRSRRRTTFNFRPSLQLCDAGRGGRRRATSVRL